MTKACDIKAKILLTEDSPVSQLMTTMTLESLHCEVDATDSVEEAFQKYKANKYDLILTDLKLSDGHGIEFVHQVRQEERRNNQTPIPIIAYTAHADELTRKACRKVGIDTLLKKPLLEKTLGKILVTYIPHYHTGKAPKPTELRKPLIGDIIDQTRLEELTGNSTIDPKKNIYPILLKTLKEEKLKLKLAFDTRNWEELKFLAHKLRGGASYGAALRLENACGNLEEYLDLGKDLNKDCVLPLYQSVMNEIDILEEVVREALK